MTDTETPHILRRIGRLFLPHRGELVIVAIAIVVSSVLGMVTPFLTRAVFDRALFPPSGVVNLHLLVVLCSVMVAIPLVTAVIGIGQTYLTTRVGTGVMADLREHLFEHLERMELSFFTATKTGSIQSRLANDVGGVGTVLTSTASSILANSVTVIASLVAMLVLSWQLSIIALALMPVFIVIQRKVGARRQRLAQRTQESLSDMTAITQEALSISGMLLSKIFNRADAELARYRTENSRLADLQVRQAMAGQGFFGVVGAFMSVTPAVVYLMAGVVSGQRAALTAGTMVAFTTIQARLLGPMMSLMRVALDVQTSLALFRRIFEYLDLRPAITDRSEAVSLTSAGVLGKVEFDGVSFRYPPPLRLEQPEPPPFVAGMRGHRWATAVPVVAPTPRLVAPSVPRPLAPTAEPAEQPERRWTLSDVSFTVEPGQLAALVGPSGAGKTTISYLVPRLYEASQGTVRIDGHDVRDLALGSLADAVGMVTQDAYLFHSTIAENLRYAKPDASDRELEAAARAANIHDTVASFPEGYQTLVGERGYRLSGGEKQRLAIARVLLKDPRILILDEATSALDSASERLVQEALAEVMRGRTTLAIAHRLSTIRHADVIIVIDDGRVVETGRHQELLDADGLYARLHAEQFGGGRIEAHFADGVMFTDGMVLNERRGARP
jgi:ATP-binding cassette subfamily B protein